MIDLIYRGHVFPIFCEYCEEGGCVDKGYCKPGQRSCPECKELDEIPRVDSICGLPLEELVLFAKACHGAGIDNGDLECFKTSSEAALKWVATRFLEELAKAWERNFLKGMPDEEVSIIL